jgi:ankyrin repeat protein
MKRVIWAFVVMGACLFGARYLTGEVKYLWFDKTAMAKDVINELEKDENKKNINVYDSAGKTGLMLAVARSDYELTQAFIKAGADVRLHAKDDTEDTAIHMACYNGDFTLGDPAHKYVSTDIKEGVAQRVSIIVLLLKAGADASVRNKRGETPLHHCMMIDNLAARRKAMQLLVARGADINAQDKNGATVLHLAVNNKEDYGVEMLLTTFGPFINFSLANNQGKTPLEYAEYLGWTDVAHRIRKYIEGLQSNNQRTKAGSRRSEEEDKFIRNQQRTQTDNRMEDAVGDDGRVEEK